MAAVIDKAIGQGEDLAALVERPRRLTSTAELIDLALTHRSYAYENGGLPTNERLEFLGDSVLGVIITEELYRRHPDLPEGQLAKLRAAVVNSRALAGGRPQHRASAPTSSSAAASRPAAGRDKSSILADAVEAVIGAYYLDRGTEATRELVLRLFARRCSTTPPTLGAGLDWKTSLQELAAERRRSESPEYVVVESGPDHQKAFHATARARRAGRRRGRAGNSKKEAEQLAAEQAWTALSAAPHRRLQPCLSFPRSRPFGSGWSSAWSDDGSTTSRSSAPAPCAATRRARPTSSPGSPVAGSRPPGDGASTCGSRSTTARNLLAHLGMSGQFLACRAGYAGPGRTCAPGSASTTAGPSCGSSTSAPSAGSSLVDDGADRRTACRGRSPTSRPTRWSRRSTRPRSRPRCAGGSTGVKRALLDQTLISGVGNIYADEALWRARLHYARATDGCGARRSTGCCVAVREVLTAADRGRRHVVRCAVRRGQRRERVVRPVARGLRPRGRAVLALRHADHPGAVHEPLVVPVPATANRTAADEPRW